MRGPARDTGADVTAIAVALEYRVRSRRAGRILAQNHYHHQFWTRYHVAFDGVVVVSRVAPIDGPADERRGGPQRALRGPARLRRPLAVPAPAPALRAVARDVVAGVSARVLRVPGQVALVERRPAVPPPVRRRRWATRPTRWLLVPSGRRWPRCSRPWPSAGSGRSAAMRWPPTPHQVDLVAAPAPPVATRPTTPMSTCRRRLRRAPAPPGPIAACAVFIGRSSSPTRARRRSSSRRGPARTPATASTSRCSATASPTALRAPGGRSRPRRPSASPAGSPRVRGVGHASGR